MQLELLGNHGRAGAALPTMQLCRDLELGIADRGQVHLLVRDPKQGLYEYPVTHSSLFRRLVAAKLIVMYFRVPEERDTSLEKRLVRYASYGEKELASMSTQTYRGKLMQHMRISG